MKDLSTIFGKEFESKLTSDSYGIFRECGAGLPEGFSITKFGTPFAEDDGGNLFTQTQHGSICFWDHETDELTVIAYSWEEFASGCTEPTPVVLKPEQVIRAWIDPRFLEEQRKKGNTS
ncbi:MAG: SMI1/KNR4 family protein [Verrucomicrobia bacterium]|nr:SMI1/KNR4 family protein [Verrucomicrobiota bacterium]